MSGPPPRPFELVPRRRFVGAPFGRRRSARRGQGDEVAGTRPYRPGDLPAHIDWPASARLSAALGTDEFVVREFYADEAPHVAIACDRRPGMAIHPSPSPWLDKRAAVQAAVRLIGASALAERAELGFADGVRGSPFWLRAGATDTPVLRRLAERFTAPEDSLRLALQSLVRHRAAAPSGSFLFVVSDFLVPMPSATWLQLRRAGWDVIPVIVQDPLWEQTFPRVAGVVLPLVDPATGREEDVWIGRRDARARAQANEQRFAVLLEQFRRLGFDPVLVDTGDPSAISLRFMAWARRRRLLRSGRP